MTESRYSEESIKFRPAQPTDASIAGRLLLATFPKKAAFIIGLGSEKRAQEILTRLFQITNHRLSYTLSEMAIIDEKVVGISIAFPGRMMGKLNRKLYGLILRQYPFNRKIALIRRALPLLFIKETVRDELFLSNLAVMKRVRGLGIGKTILASVESRAKRLSFTHVGLICAIENRDARRFYEKHGYEIKAIHLESNQRVRYLGPGTQRMVKELE